MIHDIDKIIHHYQIMNILLLKWILQKQIMKKQYKNIKDKIIKVFLDN